MADRRWETCDGRQRSSESPWRSGNVLQRPLVLASLLFLAWMIPGLAGHDPWKPDEAYSFGLVYEILGGGSWIVPTLAGEPFMEKPPAFYLTAAAFAQLLGDAMPLHDAARFASAAYVGLACLFVALAAREAFGKGVAAVAAALFIGSVGLLLPAHLLLTDLGQLAGTALALYGLLLGLRRPLAGGAAFGTGLGLAFLSKGLLLCATGAITAAVLPLLHGHWRRRSYRAFGIAGCAAVLPWLLVWPLLLRSVSPELFHEWFFDNNIGRFLGTNRLGPPAKPVHYLMVLPWFALPGLPLAIYGAIALRRTVWRQPAYLAMATLFVAVLLILSASRTARQLYALPLLVPIAVMAAPALRALPERVARRLYASEAWLFSLLVAAAWIAGLALTTGVPASLHRHLVEMRPGYTAQTSAWAVAAAAAYSAAWIAVLIGLRRNADRVAYAWAAGLTAAWGVAACFLLSWIDAGKTYRPVMAALRAQLPAKAGCMASADLGEPQRAMLHYVAGIRTRRIENDSGAAACDLILVQYRRGEAVLRPDARWEPIWDGSRTRDSVDAFVLYQRLP